VMPPPGTLREVSCIGAGFGGVVCVVGGWA